MTPTPQYVCQTGKGDWRIAGTRVSLDSVVRSYWEGKSAETIVEEFPTLTAEKVYGAIAYYLHNQREFDLYLSKQDARWAQLETESADSNQRLINRLRANRDAATNQNPS